MQCNAMQCLCARMHCIDDEEKKKRVRQTDANGGSFIGLRVRPHSHRRSQKNSEDLHLDAGEDEDHKISINNNSIVDRVVAVVNKSA